MGELVQLFRDAPTGDVDIDGVAVARPTMAPASALDRALASAADAVGAAIRLPGGEVLAASLAAAAEAMGWYGEGHASMEHDLAARRVDLRRQAAEIDEYLRAAGLPVDPEEWSAARADQQALRSDGAALPSAHAAWGVVREVSNPWMRDALLADEAVIAAMQAHSAAVALTADVVEQDIEHGSLGTFDLADDDQRDAMLRAVRRLPTLSDRTPIYDCNDATGRGQLVA